MIIDKIKLVKILLIIAGICYLVIAIAHFFGLTISPFFDERLFIPYYDRTIALAALFISILLFTIANDPIKNIDTFNALMIGVVMAIISGLYIIYSTDFVQLGAPEKKIQTIVEVILLITFLIFLQILKPNAKNNKT